MMEATMLKTLGGAGLILGVVMTMPVSAQTADGPFVKDQAINQWRASKLVGVSVTGPDQKKIGSIQDVLFDHDGNAQVVVITVGGFLGIGTKSVGVPFKTMQWRTEGRAAATVGPATMASSDAAKQPAIVRTDPAATEASQGYPDMGVLNMTKAQLQGAPDFKYAPTPTADAGPAATANPAAASPSPIPETPKN
jgi:sporulation protein YlmC with PRC-barrel domain